MAPEFKPKLDYSDLQIAPDDGRRYQLIQGDLHVTPSPSPAHQRVSLRLTTALMDYFHGSGIGEVFVAPIDLILTKTDVFVPDLLVVDDPGIVSERGIEGPPLLIVEILSPSTQKTDRGRKAARYAELGVEHYWIVDPEAERLECHRLLGNRYRPLVEAIAPARLEHPAWDGLVIDLARLWGR